MFEITINGLFLVSPHIQWVFDGCVLRAKLKFVQVTFSDQTENVLLVRKELKVSVKIPFVPNPLSVVVSVRI